MISPEIWRNEKIGALPDAGRLLFIGIFSQADDDGRLKASPRFLKANIFPYDNDKTEDRIRELRDQCAQLGLIRVYTNGNIEYLDIPGWTQHQRIRKDRYNPSQLPSFEASQVVTIPQPDGNQMTTAGMHSIGEGRGVESSIVKSNKEILPTEESPASASKDEVKKSTRLKTHQQEAGVFLDMVEKEEGVKLLSRARLVNLVRTKLFQIAETTPERLMEFYRWLKLNDPFFRNKAPPQIIGGMVDRYPSWAQGKLKGSPTRRVEPRTRPEDFKGDHW
jgi:hypothetical protein